MIASFHLVHYRGRRFAPSTQAERQVQGLRFWRALSVGPDFGALPPDFNRWTLMKPDFTRWGFFGIWDSATALEQWLASSSLVRTWRESAQEVWHVHLRPGRTHGKWRGSDPFKGFEPGEIPEAPAVVLTRAELRIRRVPTFWLSMTQVAVADVQETPGFLAGLAMVERPLVEAMTFTMWKSRNDAMSFAYRRPPHYGLTERNRSEGIVASFLYAHFYPYRSEGTWHGRDPLS